MFGSLLDEPPTEEIAANGSIIAVRDMTLPKTFSAKPPKGLLEEVVHRIDKFATITFRTLTKTRAVRAAVVIRWTGGHVDEFGMSDIACQDTAQAYNYVAVLALFPLATTPVHRQLPAVFRELWDELASKAEADKAQGFRDRLKRLQSMASERLSDDVEVRAHAHHSGTGADTQRQVRKAVAKPTAAVDEEISRPRHAFATATPSYELHQSFTARQATPQYQDMLVWRARTRQRSQLSQRQKHRAALPIAGFRADIVQAIDKHQVIILCGETGCGKSTQLPAFVLEHWLSQGRAANILCTEVRRAN
jgi:ATP-dependent RNA helicase DHX29